MVIIEYKGISKVSQVGQSLPFAHPSSILGAILAVYHQFYNTPRFPRIDMLNLASSLNLRLAVGLIENNPHHLMIIIDGDKKLEAALRAKTIIIGGHGSKVYLSKPNFIKDEKGLKKIEKINLNWLNYTFKKSKKDKEIPALCLERIDGLDDGEALTLEAQFKRKDLELCLVSQIQLDTNYYEMPIQGIYSNGVFSKKIEFINYKKIRNQLLTQMLTYGKNLDDKFKTLTQGSEDKKHELS